MANKPKKTKKRKGKIRIKQKAAIVRKDSIRRDSIRNDTLPRMQAQPPRTVAPVLKIKVRKK
jgi:hypothetical protein